MPWFSKKPKKIRLKSLVGKHTKAKLLLETRDIIYELMDKEYFFLSEKDNIIYHSLFCFNFRKDSIKFSTTSIKANCVRILKLLGIYDVTKSPIDEYFKEVLGLKQLPYTEKERLENEVKSDLKDIAELIGRYKTQQCIIDYIGKLQQGRNHEERTCIVFYIRCIEEKEKIFNYLIYKLENDAIDSSRFDSRYILGIAWLLNRPYRFRNRRDIEYFDWQKINKYRHQIPDTLVISETRKFEKLYEDRKIEKFYKEIIKVQPIKEVFTKIKNRISSLPGLSKRNNIIAELEFLFKKKRWLGFYSLALPQIEGIFTEMIKVVNNETNTNLNAKSLTDKVNAIRDFSTYHEHNLDYYQFHVPIERNKFSHFGVVNNVKIKSYGLLYDLNNILIIFHRLNTPLIDLISIMERPIERTFEDIKDFIYLFSLIKEVEKNKQIETIRPKLDIFLKQIAQNIDLHSLYKSIEHDSTISFRKLIEIIENNYYALKKSNINLLELNEKFFKQDIEKYMKIYNENRYEINEELDYLKKIEDFKKSFELFTPYISKIVDDYHNSYIGRFKKHSIMMNMIIRNLKIEHTNLNSQMLSLMSKVK